MTLRQCGKDMFAVLPVYREMWASLSLLLSLFAGRCQFVVNVKVIYFNFCDAHAIQLNYIWSAGF